VHEHKKKKKVSGERASQLPTLLKREREQKRTHQRQQQKETRGDTVFLL